MRYLTILLFGGLLIAQSHPVFAAPECKSVSKANSAGKVQKVEICLKKGTFSQGSFSPGPGAHDVYTLSLNGTKVFEKIDDQVVTFSATSDGKTVAGGCKPNLGKYQGMPVEVSRTCAVTVNGEKVGSMLFKFD